MKGIWKQLVALTLCATSLTMCKEKEEVRTEAESIALSKGLVTLSVGASVQLEAEVKPANAVDKTILWESSAPSVASVENGLIKAIKEGTANISAKCGKATAVCVVTVKAQPLTIESIMLDKNSAEIKVGEKLKLIATLAPAGATATIAWKSSDTNVATVNQGEVVALKEGKTTITASTHGHEAKCEVTVTSAAEAKFKVTISNLEALDGDFTIESPDPEMTYIYTILRKSMYEEINQRHGDVIKADMAFWGKFGDEIFKRTLTKGKQTGKLSEGITSDLCVWPNTEYIVYCYGINEKKELTTGLQEFAFRSKPYTSSSNTFSFEQKEITSSALIGSLKPSNTDGYYITIQKKTFVDHYLNKSKANEMVEGIPAMQYMILQCIYGEREHKSLDELIKTGTTELTDKYFKPKRPNTDYVLIAIGLDKKRGISTEPFLYNFKTAPKQ
ncbi:MAG: Ig-like domain-containing protein [Porphyromonadaceae bacterium]|nr:Ig-like domain-containing protein [Porphyromonadaceae bacterium]